MEMKGERGGEFYLKNSVLLYLFFSGQGQNDFSIKVITQELNYLTWEEAFTCLSDERLPDKLRSQYCDLIISEWCHEWPNYQSLKTWSVVVILS